MEWLEDEIVPIASLNQYVYCPRSCYYIYVSGEFMDNEHTVEGTYLHERVHTESERQQGEILKLRSHMIYSARYSIMGRADLIEFKNNEYQPVEYKKGHCGDWDNNRVQLCAQVMALEDALGKMIPQGYIYYFSSKRRQNVTFTPELRDKTIKTIEQVRKLLKTQQIPGVEYSPRCHGCSSYPVCLPAEVAKIKRYCKVGD